MPIELLICNCCDPRGKSGSASSCCVFDCFCGCCCFSCRCWSELRSRLCALLCCLLYGLRTPLSSQPRNDMPAVPEACSDKCQKRLANSHVGFVQGVVLPKAPIITPCRVLNFKLLPLFWFPDGHWVHLLHSPRRPAMYALCILCVC